MKELAGIGTSLVGRLAMIDGRDLRIEMIEYRWDPENPLNGLPTAPAAVATASAGMP